MDIELLSGNPLFKDINEDILRELVGSETCVIETIRHAGYTRVCKG